MTTRSHKQCLSCGYDGPGVEAGGIWHCPNPICWVSGGGLSRHAQTCSLCKTVEDGSGVTVAEPCNAMKAACWASDVFRHKRATLAADTAEPAP
jgi:hypothetical protein